MERAATVLIAIIGALSVPVVLLNFYSVIVGGVWLMVLGNWSLLGLSILSMCVSSFGLGFALVPGLLFAAPAEIAFQRQRYFIASVFALLSNLYTFAVMTVWCVGCFYVVFYSYYRGGSIWPYLLWAYGIATGPWAFMAAREGRDSLASLGAFGACIGSIAIMGTILFETHATLPDVTIAFCLPLLAVAVIQFVIGFAIEQEEARASEASSV